MASGSKIAIWAALIGNALVALTKFIAAILTGSSAILSEGIHSLVDTGNQILLLYGLRRAQRPPNREFPFGHGKEVYFWSFVVAILIFALGAGVSIYEGIVHLANPAPLVDPIVNYVVLGLAFIFEGGTLFFAFSEFSKVRGKRGILAAVKAGKDPSIFMVLFEDSAATLGLVVAFLGILLTQLTGNHVYDGLASVVIGLILAGIAVWLAYETKGLLIGESADPEVVEGIRCLARTIPEIAYVNEVLTLHMGPEFILVNLSVDFFDHLKAGQVEEAIVRLDRAVKNRYSKVKKVFVEAEARKVKAPSGEVVERGQENP